FAPTYCLAAVIPDGDFRVHAYTHAQRQFRTEIGSRSAFRRSGGLIVAAQTSPAGRCCSVCRPEPRLDQLLFSAFWRERPVLRNQLSTIYRRSPGMAPQGCGLRTMGYAPQRCHGSGGPAESLAPAGAPSMVSI